MPVGTTDDVYAKFAVLTITIDIVVVRDRFKIDARSDGNEFVQVFTIVSMVISKWYYKPELSEYSVTWDNLEGTDKDIRNYHTPAPQNLLANRDKELGSG